MSLYETLCKLSENPRKIIGGGMTDNLLFNLETKEIKSRGLCVLVKEELLLDTDEKIFLPKELLSEEEKQNPWQKLQKLYNQFYVSVPWGHSKRSYFLPKKSDELTEKELSRGVFRNEARTKLEAYILLGALEGIFKWPNESHWFWKGNNGLVVYKEWMEVK